MYPYISKQKCDFQKPEVFQQHHAVCGCLKKIVIETFITAWTEYVKKFNMMFLKIKGFDVDQVQRVKQ